MPSRRPMLIRALLAGVAVLAVATGCSDDDRSPGSENDDGSAKASAATPEAGDAARPHHARGHGGQDPRGSNPAT